MLDQATGLRTLMRRGAVEEPPEARTILVCGSQPGVGATTVATNLAFLLGQRRRVSLQSVKHSSALHCRSAADLVLLDGGCASTTGLGWSNASQILLVTTADSVAIMDAYTAIKRSAALEAPVPIAVIVNQVSECQHPGEAVHRLNRSCWRFLNIAITSAGSVPLDRFVIAASEQASVVASQYPKSPAAEALRHAAAVMSRTLQDSQWSAANTTDSEL